MGCFHSQDLEEAYSVQAGTVSEKKGYGEEKVVAALRAKRGVIVAERLTPADDFEHDVHPKTPEAKNLIYESLEEHCFLFGELSMPEKLALVEVMERKVYSRGDVIIQEGDRGDFMYVVDSGRWDVRVGSSTVATITTGGLFGELALLHNAPRAATIKLDSAEGAVYALGRETFRYTVALSTHLKCSRVKNSLAKVPLLKSLTEVQVGRLIDVTEVMEFNDGDVIITKGDTGEVFYIIHTGSVVCHDRESHDFEDVVLQAGDYFGERALLLDEPRAVNVEARGPVTCICLDRQAFHTVLGPLRQLLDHNLGVRVLKSVPLLANLSDIERQQVIEALQLEDYSEGAEVIEQGAAANKFFIVKEGELTVCVDGAEVAALHSGQYFGERALLTDEPRAASVHVASPTAQLFSLDRDTFTQRLGSLQAIMERKMEEREEEAAAHGLRRDIAFSDLQIVRTLGTGTFGRVKLAKYGDEAFALKCLSKAQIVEYGLEENIMYEKMMMAQSTHPFILRLVCTYKDADQLYMLMELVQGGELFTRMHQHGGSLPAQHALFYASCVLHAFQYIHAKHICYRDLKPENLLIDAQGYAKVVDFGFAKVVLSRTYTLCGTPEYLAPEIVLGKGHNKGVDYWALGVLIYEMLTGMTPFADYESNDTRRICRNIMQGDLIFPAALRKSSAAKDLIRKLLVRNSHKRLGCQKRGAKDIMEHPWFETVDWTALVEKRITAPWVPQLRGVDDSSNFNTFEKPEEIPPFEGDSSEWDANF